MRPQRRKKWLRQPVFLQMDGCNVTDPLKWRRTRQLGVSPAQQAELYGRAAAAGTTERCRPWRRLIADQVDPPRFKDIGHVTDGFGSVAWAESRPFE